MPKKISGPSDREKRPNFYTLKWSERENLKFGKKKNGLFLPSNKLTLSLL